MKKNKYLYDAIAFYGNITKKGTKAQKNGPNKVEDNADSAQSNKKKINTKLVKMMIDNNLL